MSTSLTGESICAVCLVQDATKDHVDFDAGTDRGFYGEGTQIPVEWIVICEDCLKSGAQHVGMVDSSERDQELEKLKVERDNLQREAKKAQEYADRLEDAFEHRAQPIEIDHRRKPRERAGAAH